METKDKKEFLKYLTITQEAFNEILTEERIQVYWEFLKEFPIEKVGEAFQRSIKELKFFPRIADLRDFITEKNRDYPIFGIDLQIEDKRNIELDREVARKSIREIFKMLGADDKKIFKPILEGKRAEEFERRRNKIKTRLKNEN